MVEYRNSNKYQSSISDSRINFHSEAKDNEYSQTFKLAKESLIISKLELKFEKMKKEKRNKLKEKLGDHQDHFDHLDDDHELSHNLPNESLRANKNQLITNYSQPVSEHAHKSNQTPSQSEVAKPRRLKINAPKSTNMDSFVKDTTESSVHVSEKTVNTENNTGFNKNYKLEELITDTNKEKSKSKFKQEKFEGNKRSNFKSESGKEEKLRNGVKFVIDNPNEHKEKKINLYLQSNIASNNTSHNTSNKSINSNNYHINHNQETKHTSNTSSNNNGLVNALLENKTKKEIAVKVNSNKSVLPNIKFNQEQEEKELKRNAHVRKRSTSCFAFLCG